jgi:hypothetical protein
MADGAANLNQNSILQEISADSPDGLAALVRKIRVPIQIINIVAVPGKYTCFFRSFHKIKVIGKAQVNHRERLRDDE